jgi:hypothetical protein
LAFHGYYAGGPDRAEREPTAKIRAHFRNRRTLDGVIRSQAVVAPEARRALTWRESIAPYWDHAGVARGASPDPTVPAAARVPVLLALEPARVEPA